jgi:succinate dehydrogenase / fumarate reductase iron-sulfur subunit
VEADARVLRMVEQHDKEGFGRCSNITSCEAECPKGISVEHIARLNRQYIGASLGSEKAVSS